MSLKSRKLLMLLVILTLALPLNLLPASAAPAAEAGVGTVTTASDAYSSKIYSQLKATMAAAALTDEINLLVYAKKGADLSSYLDNYLVRPQALPNGTTAHYGRAKVAQIGKLAAQPDVAFIQEMKFPGDLPKLPEGPAPRVNTDFGVLKARLAALKAGAQIATVTRPAADLARTADWFDVLDVHKSKAAWDLGYTGDGVKVMVNDSGIDFAHPDLQGTMARDTDPTSPYYGWPIAFDSASMLSLAYDYFLGYTFIKDGMGIVGAAPDYADTSTTRSGDELTTNPDGTLSATFAPLGGGDHTYTFPATSKSGVYHFGSHVDSVLEALLEERAAVLVVDENEAGVYDTVYVDLDADYSFVGEKAARKGSEEIYKDLDGDGYADLSGGSIYWISDGANPLPASDWLWGIGADVAGPGDLVAFTVMDWSEGGGDHGQLCASAVAAQGIIDGGSPDWKPVGDGTPFTGMIQGAGKNVGLVASGNYYVAPDATEGYLFAALGYDGYAETEDDIQIISNSWGYSGTDNDSWDWLSRTVDTILRYVNPTLSDMNSTGNGAPGYGTVTSPGDTLGISVGASTLYDTTGSFDSITSVDQLVYNDLMSWSNRGPTALGDNGVSVLAEGAWGAGALALTETLDGWNAWASWGGTSKSTPTAAGNVALIYEAFKTKNGRWPTNIEARAILMAGADKAYNDGFSEGAGTVNALESVKIAAGLSGAYATPDSWTFGDFRGTEYEAFAKIMHPGQTSTKAFTVFNPGAADITLQVKDEWLVRTGQKTIDFTSKDRTLEEGDANRADYLFDLTGMIPAGTDIIDVRLTLPFEQFEPQGDYNLNNNSQWRLNVLDWTDVNGDGNLWQDLNGNGIVNCPAGLGSAGCEMDKGEYVRFGYGYNSGNAVAQRVKQPLDRMHDGIFAALRHRNRTAAAPITDLKITVTFYKMADFPWLTTDASVTVPAGGSATFNATLAVPALANIGLYNAFLRLTDATTEVSIPVVANVAAFSTDFLFGGLPKSTAPYDNGEVYGHFDWGWRNESGDWRFFFVDVPDSTPAGTNFLIDTKWTGDKSDIDTIVMGPQEDCFSNGVGCEFPFSTFPGDPDVYGPYTLAPVGGSNRNYMGSGKWLWDTSTGGPREIVAAPAEPGLNVIALQNVLFDGSEAAERFQGQVGTISATPSMPEFFVGNATSGSFPMTVKSSLPLVGLVAEGFGMSDTIKDKQPQVQDDPNDPSTATYKYPFTLEHAARLDVKTSGAAGDMDLFVLYDFNGDGAFDFDSEVIGSSTTSTANEFVSITMPPDGNYIAAVHGWNAANTTFDIAITAVQGYDLNVTNLPAGPYQPNTPINFTVEWQLDAPLAPGEVAEGLILAGPPGAEAALQIPVRLHNITTGVETVTLAATEDTYIQGGMVNLNFGAWAYLYVGGSDVLRSLVKFDTAAIDAMYPVKSAKLQVWVDGYGSTGQRHTLMAHNILTPWAEMTATWKTPWTKPGGDVDLNPAGQAFISKADVGKWVEVDVTPLVAQWVANPTSNNGVLLRAVMGESYATFRLASSEYYSPDKAPRLVVEYAIP